MHPLKRYLLEMTKQCMHVREQGQNKVLVILNLSATEQKIILKDESLLKESTNVFTATKETPSKEWTMKPWGYAVYEYR